MISTNRGKSEWLDGTSRIPEECCNKGKAKTFFFKQRELGRKKLPLTRKGEEIRPKPKLGKISKVANGSEPCLAGTEKRNEEGAKDDIRKAQTKPTRGKASHIEKSSRELSSQTSGKKGRPRTTSQNRNNKGDQKYTKTTITTKE